MREDVYLYPNRTRWHESSLQTGEADQYARNVGDLSLDFKECVKGERRNMESVVGCSKG